MPQAISFTTLKIPGLIEAHNVLASTRGVPPLRNWHDSRCKLAERVALLRTQKMIAPTPANDNTPQPKPKAPPRPKRRRQPVRDAILKSLAFISHYENAKTGVHVHKLAAWRHERADLISVGLPYSEVFKMVKKLAPDSNVSCAQLRLAANQVRAGQPGFAHCKLPTKRPHSSQKGKVRCKISQPKKRRLRMKRRSA